MPVLPRMPVLDDCDLPCAGLFPEANVGLQFLHQAAELGSRITGRWLSSLRTGTAEMSQVLRVAVSKVRMPRSQRSTFELPWATRYSADMSNSLMVALSPRFS